MAGGHSASRGVVWKLGMPLYFCQDCTDVPGLLPRRAMLPDAELTYGTLTLAGAATVLIQQKACCMPRQLPSELQYRNSGPRVGNCPCHRRSPCKYPLRTSPSTPEVTLAPGCLAPRLKLTGPKYEWGWCKEAVPPSVELGGRFMDSADQCPGRRCAGRCRNCSRCA